MYFMAGGSSNRVRAYPACPHLSIGRVGQNHVESFERIFPWAVPEVSLKKMDVVEVVHAGALPCLADQFGLDLDAQQAAPGVLPREKKAYKAVPATEISHSERRGRLDKTRKEETVNRCLYS